WRSARARHPGNLSSLRQTRRRYDRECDYVSGAKRSARDRKSAKFFTEHARSLFAFVRERRFPTHPRARSTNRAGRFAENASADAGIRWFVSRHLRIAAASWAALRRDDYLPEQTEFVCALGKRLHARPGGGAMGQGRL